MMMSLEIIRRAEAEFSDCVRGSFSRSILNDIFSPIIMELGALEQLDENIQAEMQEIDKRAAEARSLI